MSATLHPGYSPWLGAHAKQDDPVRFRLWVRDRKVQRLSIHSPYPELHHVVLRNRSMWSMPKFSGIAEFPGKKLLKCYQSDRHTARDFVDRVVAVRITGSAQFSGFDHAARFSRRADVLDGQREQVNGFGHFGLRQSTRLQNANAAPSLDGTAQQRHLLQIGHAEDDEAFIGAFDLAVVENEHAPRTIRAQRVALLRLEFFSTRRHRLR